MNAPTTFPLDKVPHCAALSPLDDIRTFLGDIPADEYEARAKLRAFRNAATAMIASTDSADARCLAWMTAETITPLLFCPGLDTADLLEAGKFAKRLMLTAMQAEELRDKGMLP